MVKILDIKNVTFKFGERVVLDNVTFTLEKGDFLGLIGPNGSGKTTLLKLILKLYDLQKGSIKVLGTNIKDFKDWGKVGYVSQKATNIDANFPGTVFEIVSSGLKGNLSKSSVNDACVRALKLTDVLDLKDRNISKLSGGQQQRVLIARAIVSEPELIILDEPTTGVDDKNRKSFYELLDFLNKQGITVVLVSHDTSTVTKYVNKVACLNKKLVFHGKHEEFCSKHLVDEDYHLLFHSH